MTSAVLAALWLASSAPPVKSPPVPAPCPQRGSQIYSSLQLDRLSPGNGGGALSVGWLRSLCSGALLETGAGSFSLHDSRWGYGRLGLSVRAGRRSLARLEVDLGGGRRQREGFGYRIYKAGLAHEAVPGRLVLELEDQYVDVDGTRGNVLKLAATISPRSFLDARLAYHRSMSGNIGEQGMSGKLGFRLGRLGLLAGLSSGRRRPEVAGIYPGSGVLRSSEAFFGVSVERSGRELGLVVDSLRTGGARRTTVALTAKVRL